MKYTKTGLASSFSTLSVLVVSACVLLMPLTAYGTSRIKDIVNIEGVRDNMLIGYGLVVGLKGTGDSISDGHFTKESLQSMLNRMGIKTTDSGLDSDNVAAVIVTATLPPFSRKGNRIDVTVSALGDADSLLGGTLLVTPLMGADGEVYAVAQGQLAVGGFDVVADGNTVSKGVSTSARIANGAIVEKEINFSMADMRTITLTLRNPDFTTARRISNAINSNIGVRVAHMVDLGTVRVQVPNTYTGGVVGLITDIEQYRVQPDQIARVVIDEQSGTIVMGDDVQINRIAIAQGNLTIRIATQKEAPVPGPFSAVGEIPVVENTTINADENATSRMTVVDSGITLQELVNGLNALGIGPRDMITILQAIKTAGALQAEIEVM